MNYCSKHGRHRPSKFQSRYHPNRESFRHPARPSPHHPVRHPVCHPQPPHIQHQHRRDYPDSRNFHTNSKPEYEGRPSHLSRYSSPSGEDFPFKRSRPTRCHTFQDFMTESAKYLYNKRNTNERSLSRESCATNSDQSLSNDDNSEEWQESPDWPKSEFESTERDFSNNSQVPLMYRSLRDRVLTPDYSSPEEQTTWNKPLCPPLSKWLAKDITPRSKDSKLYEMFKKQMMCDVIILTAEGTVQAHKIALCLKSSALMDIFSHYSGNDVFRLNLSDFKGEVIVCMLIYVYTGEVRLNSEIVGQVMLCAQRCQMAHLAEICKAYIRNNLDVNNAVLFYSIAANNNDDDLREEAFKMIVDNFANISRTTHFMLLPFERLRPILDNGRLKVRNEKDVFDAIINWVNFCPKKRIPMAHLLLSCVRLKYIPPEQLAEEAEQNEWLLSDINCLRYCVYEPMRYHVTHKQPGKSKPGSACSANHSINPRLLTKFPKQEISPMKKNISYSYTPERQTTPVNYDISMSGQYDYNMPVFNDVSKGMMHELGYNTQDYPREYPRENVLRNEIMDVENYRHVDYSEQIEKHDTSSQIPSGTAMKLFQNAQQFHRQTSSQNPSTPQSDIQRLAQQLLELSNHLVQSQKSDNPYSATRDGTSQSLPNTRPTNFESTNIRPPRQPNYLRDPATACKSLMTESKQNLMPFQPLLNSKHAGMKLINEEKEFISKISAGGEKYRKDQIKFCQQKQQINIPSFRSHVESPPSSPQSTQSPQSSCPQVQQNQIYSSQPELYQAKLSQSSLSQQFKQPQLPPQQQLTPLQQLQQLQQLHFQSQQQQQQQQQPQIQQQMQQQLQIQPQIQPQMQQQLQMQQQIQPPPPQQQQQQQEQLQPSQSKPFQPSSNDLENAFKPEEMPQILDEIKRVTSISNIPPNRKKSEHKVCFVQEIKFDKMTDTPPFMILERPETVDKEISPEPIAQKMEININQLRLRQPKKFSVIKGCEGRASTPNFEQNDRNLQSVRSFQTPEKIGDSANNTEYLRPSIYPTAMNDMKKFNYISNPPRGRGSSIKNVVRLKNTNRSNIREHVGQREDKLSDFARSCLNKCSAIVKETKPAYRCCNQNNCKYSLSNYLQDWSIGTELGKVDAVKQQNENHTNSKCPGHQKCHKTKVHFHRSPLKQVNKERELSSYPIREINSKTKLPDTTNRINSRISKAVKKKDCAKVSQSLTNHVELNSNQNARTNGTDDSELEEETGHLDVRNYSKQKSQPSEFDCKRYSHFNDTIDENKTCRFSSNSQSALDEISKACEELTQFLYGCYQNNKQNSSDNESSKNAERSRKHAGSKVNSRIQSKNAKVIQNKFSQEIIPRSHNISSKSKVELAREHELKNSFPVSNHNRNPSALSFNLQPSTSNIESNILKNLNPPILEINGVPINVQEYDQKINKECFRSISNPHMHESPPPLTSSRETADVRSRTFNNSGNILNKKTTPDLNVLIFGGVDIPRNKKNEVTTTNSSTLILKIEFVAKKNLCANSIPCSCSWIQPDKSIFIRWELENITHCGCVRLGDKLHLLGGVVDTTSIHSSSEPDRQKLSSSSLGFLHEISKEIKMRVHKNMTPLHSSVPFLLTAPQENLKTTKSHDIFDFRSRKWSTATSMPAELIYFSTTTWRSKILIIGGVDATPINNTGDVSTFKNKLLCYDSNSNKWSEYLNTPFENPTIGLSVTVSNDHLFIVGGMAISDMSKFHKTNSHYQLLDSFYKLNLNYLDWRILRFRNFKTPSLKTEIQEDNEIPSENDNNMDQTNHDRRLWENLHRIKSPRSFGNLVSIKDKLYLIGGLQYKSAVSTVEVYNQSDDYWELFIHLSCPRYAMKCILTESRIFIIGGFTNFLQNDEKRADKKNEIACLEPFCHCRATDVVELIDLNIYNSPKSFVLTRIPFKKIGFQSVAIQMADTLS